MTDDTDNDSPDAEELLQQTKEQSRTNTPAAQSDDDSPETPSLPEAVADELAAIEAGDSHPNLTVRDENMAALLDALAATGELSDVVSAASERTDQEPSSDNRSEAIRQLVRVGLQEIDPEILDQGREGHKRYAERQASQSGF